MLAAMPCAKRLACGDAELHLVEQQRLLHRGLQQLDLPRRLVGDAEVAHLARRMQRVEGLGDIVGLDQRVRPVQQQHVEVLGLAAP